MEPRPTSDSFGTFLKTIQSHGAFEEQSQSRQQLSPDMLGDSLKILGNLAGSGSRPVPELLEKSGIEFTKFADVLKTMEAQSLIAFVGEPGQQLVEITPEGEQIVRAVGG